MDGCLTVFHIDDVASEYVESAGAKGVKIQWLIDKNHGARNFAMRRFIIEAGGHTPYHKHVWEHELFVLEGEGQVRFESMEYDLRKGNVVFVPPMKLHQFKTDSRMILLCMIPIKK